MDVKARAKVTDFLRDLLLKKDDTESLADSESLFMSGRLDSLSQVELVVFLEQEFGLDFVDIDFDRIDSIDAIGALIGEANC
jgi:acyl carrier protein